MKRWQQFCITIGGNKSMIGNKENPDQEVNNCLAHYGAEGWELVSATTIIVSDVVIRTTLFFKREVL